LEILALFIRFNLIILLQTITSMMSYCQEKEYDLMFTLMFIIKWRRYHIFKC